MDSKFLNEVTLSGNIASDVKTFTTSTGKTKSTFSIAHNYLDQEQKKAMFMDIVSWKQMPDGVGKGIPVTIRGFLRPRSYQHGDKTVTVIEIIANEVERIVF